LSGPKGSTDDDDLWTGEMTLLVLEVEDAAMMIK